MDTSSSHSSTQQSHAHDHSNQTPTLGKKQVTHSGTSHKPRTQPSFPAGLSTLELRNTQCPDPSELAHLTRVDELAVANVSFPNAFNLHTVRLPKLFKADFFDPPSRSLSTYPNGPKSLILSLSPRTPAKFSPVSPKSTRLPRFHLKITPSRPYLTLLMTRFLRRHTSSLLNAKSPKALNSPFLPVPMFFLQKKKISIFLPTPLPLPI